jgi:hypothetical protein
VEPFPVSGSMNPNSEDENTGRCILQADFCAAQIVERRETLRVIAEAENPDESRVPECALEGRAEVIVSGDRDKVFCCLECQEQSFRSESRA